VQTQRVEIETGRRRTIVDVTDEVASFVAGRGDGLVNVALPHATAGLALMELGSGSERDLMDRIDALLPREGRYVHSHGSPGHGADHLLPAFIAPTLTLPVLAGRVALGIWQRIALVDTNVDNPRRELLLAFVPSPGDR
jgi:secondary thiamine-phosphate synthase enzyme